MDNVTKDILLHAAVWFLLLGGVAGLGMGGLLIWRPDRLRGLSGTLNRWVSTRHLEAPLERTVAVDPWFYKHRRLSAGLILLGAFYMLYFFSMGLDQQSSISGIASRFGLSSAGAAWLLDVMVLASLCGAVLAIFVSLFLLLRPSSLRDFEQGANSWISLRRAMKPVEVEHDGLDEFVLRHARHVGMVLVAGSLYVLVLLATWIGHV